MRAVLLDRSRPTIHSVAVAVARAKPQPEVEAVAELGPAAAVPPVD
jgi:hypothetical protein